MPPTWLEDWQRMSAERRRAWVGFLRAHAQVVADLDRQLERAHGLPLTSYDVLLQLSSAGERGMQMSRLADAVVLSRSGLTRRVERLEREGLVERRPGERDVRQTFARITPAGRARLAESTPTHLAGVRRRFLDRLSDEQVEQLAGIWDQLVAEAPRAAGAPAGHG